VWSSVGFLGRFLLPYFLGICALAWFLGAGPDGAAFVAPDATPETTLAAMPAFLARVLPSGILGLVAAGMLAAFMSTHDSYLLCWASVLTQDVAGPLSGERLSTRARLALTRGLVLAIGVFLLVWSLWYPLGQDLWDYMAITGAVYFTGAFALLVPGLYWRGASRVGAYLALAAGCTAVLGLAGPRAALGLGDTLSLGLLGSVPLDAAHVGLGATGLALALMVAGSLLWPDRSPRAALPAAEGAA
jgi:SSS family solute:Na+ symporter